MIHNDNKQTTVIECKQLTKVYKGHKGLLVGCSKAVCALKNISLSVSKGQIIGLIGPNGAGKTTFLNLMAGLIFPTKGCVTVCGYPARSIEARSGLGYMPEYPAFLGSYSARAVLRYHGALLGLSHKAISLRTDKSSQQLQMKEFIDRPCSGFSQGMKQRLALAVALMNDPQVLLLDEPSNGLDPVGIIQLRDMLKQLRDSGAAIVISSHRLGELEKLTSDYVFLYRGEVISLGDRIVAGQAGRLRVELVSNGNDIAEKLLSPSKILGVSDTELEIAVSNREEVPDIVNNLAKGGARITGVLLQRENIEDVFLRLYNERN
ncbi:MAG TPA: ABC transporter ATP-binding protein [Sedimentisphaerales bacterium]|nr:ABC transporter ATP-binding protein [Sedimentisphaerales bacterium]